jgi:hypothetical protein
MRRAKAVPRPAHSAVLVPALQMTYIQTRRENGEWKPDATLEEDEKRAEATGSGETDVGNTKSLMSDYDPNNVLDGYIKKEII